MARSWIVNAGIRSAVVFFCVTLTAFAGPILHERFAPDPSEDLQLGATTTAGAMPAALDTPSGLISAPNQDFSTESAVVYGGAKTASSSDGEFHLDRVTTRPSHVQYDEPFRPSILPFKRLYAFDQVSEDGSFTVVDSTLHELAIGGSVDTKEEAFFADFELDLVRGVPVRIVSVGPGARLIALEVDPDVSLEVLRDSAENWFARARETRRVRVLMQLAVRRQSMGSHFLPVGWPRLRPFAVSLPSHFDERARSMWSLIGVSRELSPAFAVQTLVRYFRAFQEARAPARALDSLDLFEELTRRQEGVCRHRAYAFAVVAMSLGIPTRLVHNEAHAWVEVFDSEIWHRIDLGGAAMNLQLTRDDPHLPLHRPPPDPYSWPLDAQPTARSMPRQGRDAWRDVNEPPVDGAVAERGPAGLAESTSSNSAAAVPLVATAAPDQGASSASAQQTSGQRLEEPPRQVQISLRIDGTRVLRGHPVTVAGSVSENGRPCRRARVDVLLGNDSGWLALGSVATDQRGDFEGQVSVPRDAPVGTLPFVARLHAGCAP